jgi:ankyrin repeat protein
MLYCMYAQDGIRPLTMASKNGNVDAVKVLLEAKADVDLASKVMLGVYIYSHVCLRCWD